MKLCAGTAAHLGSPCSIAKGTWSLLCLQDLGLQVVRSGFLMKALKAFAPSGLRMQMEPMWLYFWDKSDDPSWEGWWLPPRCWRKGR